MTYELVPGIRIVTDIADIKCYEQATGRFFVAGDQLAIVLGLIVRGHDTGHINLLLTQILPATAFHARCVCEAAVTTLLQERIIRSAFLNARAEEGNGVH